VHAAVQTSESRARAETGGAASIVEAPAALPAQCAGFVVANRTVSHLDAIEALLPRGLPIFTEKPIGVDVARARRLPDAAHQLVFVMHKWRYHPGVIELARIAASDEYGPVEGLRLYRLGWGDPHVDVNATWVLAPHDLSIALHILGETPDLVSASVDPMGPQMAGAIAHLRTRAGIPVTIEVSSAHPSPMRRIMMRCRDAVCQLDSVDYGAVTIARFDEAKPRVIRVADDMPLLAELRAFVEHLRGGSPPVTALRDEIDIISRIADIESAIRGS
jgi:predicted dehydrogenase